MVVGAAQRHGRGGHGHGRHHVHHGGVGARDGRLLVDHDVVRAVQEPVARWAGEGGRVEGIITSVTTCSKLPLGHVRQSESFC